MSLDEDKLLLVYLAALSWGVIWIGIYLKRISNKLGIKTDEIVELRGILNNERSPIIPSPIIPPV